MPYEINATKSAVEIITDEKKTQKYWILWRQATFHVDEHPHELEEEDGALRLSPSTLYSSWDMKDSDVPDSFGDE